MTLLRKLYFASKSLSIMFSAKFSASYFVAAYFARWIASSLKILIFKIPCFASTLELSKMSGTQPVPFMWLTAFAKTRFFWRKFIGEMFAVAFVKFEIFGSIVRSVSIYMMNNFSNFYISTKIFFHNKYVFENIPANSTRMIWFSNSDISLICYNSSAIPRRVFLTGIHFLSVNTKTFFVTINKFPIFKLTRRSIDFFMTHITSCFHTYIITHISCFVGY